MTDFNKILEKAKEIETLDDGTLISAFKNRRDL